jgi:hypothetical protein
MLLVCGIITLIIISTTTNGAEESNTLGLLDLMTRQKSVTQLR